eukprot:763622-Hanusia_phi.AAC.2
MVNNPPVTGGRTVRSERRASDYAGSLTVLPGPSLLPSSRRRHTVGAWLSLSVLSHAATEPRPRAGRRPGPGPE